MQEHDRLLAPMACPGFLSISIHLVMTGSRDFSVASFSSSTDWNLKGPVPRRSRLIMRPLAAFTLTQDNSSLGLWFCGGCGGSNRFHFSGCHWHWGAQCPTVSSCSTALSLLEFRELEEQGRPGVVGVVQSEPAWLRAVIPGSGNLKTAKILPLVWVDYLNPMVTGLPPESALDLRWCCQVCGRAKPKVSKSALARTTRPAANLQVHREPLGRRGAPPDFPGGPESTLGTGGQQVSVPPGGRGPGWGEAGRGLSPGREWGEAAHRGGNGAGMERGRSPGRGWGSGRDGATLAPLQPAAAPAPHSAARSPP